MVRSPLHFHGRIPVPEVAPLTYRDGVTHLELVYELSQYLKNILHPSLQSTIDQVVADAEQLLSDATAQYVDGVQEFQRIHDAFMSDVEASLRALNDTVVADLVDDDASYLSRTLRNLFLEQGDVDEVVADYLRDTVSSTRTAAETVFDSYLQQNIGDYVEIPDVETPDYNTTHPVLSHTDAGVVEGDVVSLVKAIESTPENTILTLPPDMVFNLDETLTIDTPVHITGGTFRGDRTLIQVTVDGVTIEDATFIGAGNTLEYDGSTALSFRPPVGDIISFTVKNVVIRDVRSNGIDVRRATNFRIEGCGIKNFRYAGIAIGDKSSHGVITRNVIDNANSSESVKYNSYGIYVSNNKNGSLEDRGHSIEISHNRISRIVDWEGIDTHNGVNLDIIHNHVTASRNGIALVANMNIDNSGVEDIRVIGNFVDCEGWSDDHFNHSVGIKMLGHEDRKGDAIITGNTVLNATYPVRFHYDEPERYRIRKCRIFGNADGGSDNLPEGTEFDTGWKNLTNYGSFGVNVESSLTDPLKIRHVGDNLGRTAYIRGVVHRSRTQSLMFRFLPRFSFLLPSSNIFGSKDRVIIGVARKVTDPSKTENVYLHGDRRIRIGDESSGLTGSYTLDCSFRNR